MPVHLPSHLYRNRHGTFYFRLVIPAALREAAQRREIHASLGTERRQEAIIRSLPYIEAIPRLLSELQTMTDEKKVADQRYVKAWMSAVKKNMQQLTRIEALESEIFELRAQLARSVPRNKAEEVVRNTYTVGQLRGKQELESRLAFPWPAEKTAPFSELLERYLDSFTYRAIRGAKPPPTEKTMQSYRADIGFFSRVMTDLRIGAIDKEVAGQYFNVLRRLPPNLNKSARYKGKTIDEILALDDPPQSEDNASKKMERTSSMFAWALEERRKWGIDANPFTGFGQAGNNETTRRPFTLDEIRQLLQHRPYAQRHFRSQYSFWLIPLAVFTGARLGELCQLALNGSGQTSCLSP